MVEKAVTDSVARLLSEHLAASRQFIESGDYPRINVQANRIMTDASLSEEDPVLALTRLVLRLAWFETSTSLSPKPPKFALEFPQNKALVALIDALVSIVESDSRPRPKAPCWNAYEQFHRSFWQASRPKVEGRSYTSNKIFVDSAFRWASSRLGEWKGLLGQVRGAPIEGILGELNRIVRGQGADARQLACLGAIHCLSWRREIVNWKLSGADGLPNSEGVMKALQPDLEKVAGLYEIEDDGRFYSELTEVTSRLIRNWRLDFIAYYDLFLAEQRMGVPVHLEAMTSGRREAKKGRRVDQGRDDKGAPNEG